MKRQETEELARQIEEANKNAQQKKELVELISRHVPEIAKVDDAAITVKRITEGMSNLVYKVLTEGEGDLDFIVKKFLKNPEDEDHVKINFYDREVMKRMIEIGYGAKIYYSSLEEGYEVQQMIPGKVFSPELLEDEKVMGLLIAELALFHETLIDIREKAELNTKNLVLDMIEKGVEPKFRAEFNRLLTMDKIGDDIKADLKHILEIFESEQTKKILEVSSRENFPFIFSHNDVNIFNIFYDEEKQNVTLLDFEYACFSAIGHDLAYLISGSVHNFGHPEAYFRPEKFPDEQKLDKMVDSYLGSFKDLKKVFEGFDLDKAKEIVLESLKSSFIVVNVFWIFWSMFMIDNPHAPFNWHLYLQSRIDLHNFIIQKYWS